MKIVWIRENQVKHPDITIMKIEGKKNMFCFWNDLIVIL